MAHPGVEMHQAIDIIRGKADQDYLDEVSKHCNSHITESENYGSKVKEIIYLDRNNTPDVWADISTAIMKTCKKAKFKDFKSVLILP